jgi:hypothetical protein
VRQAGQNAAAQADGRYRPTTSADSDDDPLLAAHVLSTPWAERHVLSKRDQEIRFHLVVDVAEDDLFDLLTVHFLA